MLARFFLFLTLALLPHLASASSLVPVEIRLVGGELRTYFGNSGAPATPSGGSATVNWTAPSGFSGGGTVSVSDATGALDFYLSGSIERTSATGTVRHSFRCDCDIEFDVPDFGTGNTLLVYTIEVLSYSSSTVQTFSTSANFPNGYVSGVIGGVAGTGYEYVYDASDSSPESYVASFLAGDTVSYLGTRPSEFYFGSYSPSVSETEFDFTAHGRFSIWAAAPTSVPEPSVSVLEPTTTLLLAGGLMVVTARRRRQ